MCTHSPILIDYPCARHWAKNFRCVISFNHHRNLMKSYCCLHFKDQETESQKDSITFLA